MTRQPGMLPCLSLIPAGEQLGNRNRVLGGVFREQAHGLFLHLMHNVNHRAIAVTHNGNHAVGEFDSAWLTGELLCTFAQPFNGHHFHTGFFQTFSQFRTRRVNGDTVVSDRDVYAGARGYAGQDVINQRRDASANQRSDNDGKRSGNRSIAVTAGCAAQYAVRTGQYVNVEAGINFQRTQHHDVQTIDGGAF